MVKKYSLYVLIFCLPGCSALYTTFNASKLQSIPVELTTHLGDSQQFVEGDEIQFLLSLGSDAFIYMYYIDAANNIKQILPNENQQSNFYAAGYFLTIPEYENVYRFTVSEPFGNESIWVFASDQSILMKPLPASIENIEQLIKNSSEKAFGEYVLNIVTTRHGKNGQ